MSDKITPALTPDEWDDEAFDGGHGFDHPGARFELDGYSLEIKPHGFEDDPSKWITLGGRALHALAALALHGEPFGFTHEDIHLLTRVVLASNIDRDTFVAVDRLAGRIAALLPPKS